MAIIVFSLGLFFGCLLFKLYPHGVRLLCSRDRLFRSGKSVGEFGGLLHEGFVFFHETVFLPDLLAEDIDALAGRGDLAALLRSVSLCKLLHAAVNIQPEKGAQDLHAAVAVCLQKQAVCVLADKGDGAECVAVHSEQADDLLLCKRHGRIARVVPGIRIRVEPLERKSSASAFRACSDNAVFLVAEGEGEGNGAALCAIAHPAADVFFSGLLIKAVGNRIHKEAALSNTVLAVDHCHVYGVEVKGGFRVAAVVLYFDGKRCE